MLKNYILGLSANPVRFIAYKIILSLVLGLTITGFAWHYTDRVKADIENSVVRLHVLANSDSDLDQQLKLKVRDRVIEYLKDKLANANSTDETKLIISNELENIKNVAIAEIENNGYNYNVETVLGNFDFPTKQYGDSQFPAGKYDALRILIGKAEGKNWWCVLYPQLCFIDNTNGKLPDESKEKLKNVLTDDEYNIVTSPNGNIPVKIKFRILEIFCK